MTIAAWLLVAALLGGGWLWTPDKPRDELEARYGGEGSEFVNVDGVRLHLRDSAAQAPPDTPTLILLHGFGASLHTWEPWAQALKADWRVIRFDLPGAGLTGPDPGNDYSDERAMRLMVALMEQRGVAHATVIGHSMGGRLAWRFAAAQPQRVDKLVLLAPDGFASPGFEYGKAPDVPWTMHLMNWALPRPLLRMALAPAYADPQHLDDTTVKRYHDLLLAPGVRPALIARMQQLVLQEPRPLLQRIASSTLLMWGDKDQLIPPANAQDYLSALPHARLVLLPGVGHLPQEEAPAASLPPLRAFLAE